MTLQRALLVSIALHALLLAIARPPQGLPQESKRAPLVVRLVEPAPVEAPPAVKPVPLLKKLVRTTPRAQPSTQPLNEVRVEVPVAVEVPLAAEGPRQEPPPQFDPGAIARYRLEIISAAKQFRRYPPIARENGWQGRAEVRVSFDGAREPAVVLNRSSGYAVLDRQAVETLAKALAPLPPPLAGQAFELDFPVVFSLDE